MQIVTEEVKYSLPFCNAHIMFKIRQKKPLTASENDTIKERLEELLNDLIKTNNIMHAITAVESGDGSFQWSGARGAANPDGTPMEVETPFWIASVTKLFIAAVILKLHEQDRISINHAMSAYLPQSITRELHLSNGADYTNKITIRHLLSHSSGLPDYLIVHTKGEKSLFESLLEEGDRTVSIDESMQIVRRVKSPHFPPRSLEEGKKKVRYSDTNFQLLIAIITAVTGQSLHAAFEEMLYKPLNLKQTFLPGTLPTDPVSQAATVWYKDMPLNIPKAMSSIGDLNSTIVDLLAFMRALIYGRVFAKPITLDLMLNEWNKFGLSFSPVGPGWPIEYSLGMMRFKMPRIFTPFNPMPGVIGHTGASGSWLFYCPSMDIFLAGNVSQITAGAVPFKVVPKQLSILNKYF
ncbi:serine hydrolase domain-containing protein [Desulfitibacter alkalitolerans]|uniref:serine hydrolase domain-containing protein n=1 Tax=Desulfitibacter alkalitolerans TaxID=264641 RepID=UPI001FA777B5|nr:serine hydrolase domain-containing protein [Desulfitibacter alkalitolerans]